MGLSGEVTEQGTDKILRDILAENNPDLVKNIYIHIEEAQWTPSGIKTKRSTPRHIIVVEVQKCWEANRKFWK